MMSSTYLNYGEELVAEGKISEAEIDRSVQRILDLKEKHNMFKKPYAGASEKKEHKLFLSKEHRAICREAAVKSAVLLKNDGVLPFSENIEKLAVIGPFAKQGMIGFWSCSGVESEAVDAYQGMKNVLGGKKLPEEKALELAYRAIQAGAAGVDMGRNVFQSAKPLAMMKAISAVVHQGLSAQDAFQLYNDEK